MSDVQAIADGFEIEALRGEFTDAVMMRDYDRLASLFTRDGAVRIPDINAEAVSREEIRAGIERLIAGHGWYHTRLGHGVPWLPVAVAGFFGLLLALRRIPVAARALAAPGMVSLELPHSFRVIEGSAFLLTMALGHLPALFALPAGLGDIAAGLAAPLVARRLAQGTGRRAARWFTGFGMTDLVNALTLGALTGFQLLNVTPSGAPISGLPLALIPTAAMPLLLALHITSGSALARAPRTPRPATAPLTAAI